MGSQLHKEHFGKAREYLMKGLNNLRDLLYDVNEFEDLYKIDKVDLGRVITLMMADMTYNYQLCGRNPQAEGSSLEPRLNHLRNMMGKAASAEMMKGWKREVFRLYVGSGGVTLKNMHDEMKDWAYGVSMQYLEDLKRWNDQRKRPGALCSWPNPY